MGGGGLGILANFDDARNPPSEPYRDLLLDAGCEVAVHDPHVLEYPGVDIFHELSAGRGALQSIITIKLMMQ